MTASRRGAIGRNQKLLAICEKTPDTSVPMVVIAEKATIEMKKAIIAYSIAVAPLRSSLISPSLKSIAGRLATSKRRSWLVNS